MTDNPKPKDTGEVTLANKLTLEICFLALIGLIVVAAFFEALTYKLVSSRTPLVIMVPLFALILIHAWRLFKVRGHSNFRERVGLALSGRMPDLNKVVSMSLWMCVLLVLIAVLGHYVGIFLFGFVLMRMLERESLWMAISVSVSMTVIIYIVFEMGFDVGLYRGLLWRYFKGYNDF